MAHGPQLFTAGSTAGVVVLGRLLRGEPLDALCRELGVEVFRLERWKDMAWASADAGLKGRTSRTFGRAEVEALT